MCRKFLPNAQRPKQNLNNKENVSKKEVKNDKKQFRWTPKMIEHLIESIQSYKSAMMYKNLDFDADKSSQYSAVREAMTAVYCDDVNLFGPIEANLPLNFNDLSKEDQIKIKRELKQKRDSITKEKNRIMEKTKEVRQAFSKAVMSGSHSESEKLVFEHYDKLIYIWRGSANTEPLPFGVSSEDFVGNNEDNTGSYFSFYEDNVDDTSNDSLAIFNSDQDVNSNPGKRKSTSVVPKLIDNKRKHLEKSLSAAQRDQLLTKEMKSDAEFRQDLAQAMRESNECFSDFVKEIRKSMSDLSKSLCSSMELFSRYLLLRSNHHNFNNHHYKIYFIKTLMDTYLLNQHQVHFTIKFLLRMKVIPEFKYVNI